MAEEHPGSAVVIVDEDHGDEPLHDLDPAAASGGLAGRGPPRAMVDDLDADAAGLGPEGQLDGTVDGRGGVGVLDAVAGGLVHQVRAIIRHPHSAIRAIEALAITVPVFLLLFAATYFVGAAAAAIRMWPRLPPSGLR